MMANTFKSKLARLTAWVIDNKFDRWLRARPRLKWTLLILLLTALVWAIATPVETMGHFFGL